MGHGREFWQNVVHWRREWQTTSVFLPWEPHEQYELRLIGMKTICYSICIYSINWQTKRLKLFSNDLSGILYCLPQRIVINIKMHNYFIHSFIWQKFINNPGCACAKETKNDKSWSDLKDLEVELIDCYRSHDREHHNLSCAGFTLLGGVRESSTEGLASDLPLECEEEFSRWGGQGTSCFSKEWESRVCSVDNMGD